MSRQQIHGIEERMAEFLKLYGRRGAKPSLGLFAVMCWVLDIEPSFELTDRPREMTADDIGVTVTTPASVTSC